MFVWIEWDETQPEKFAFEDQVWDFGLNCQAAGRIKYSSEQDDYLKCKRIKASVLE